MSKPRTPKPGAGTRLKELSKQRRAAAKPSQELLDMVRRCKHKLVLPAYGRVSSEGMLILSDFKCAKCGCKLRISFRKVK